LRKKNQFATMNNMDFVKSSAYGRGHLIGFLTAAITVVAPIAAWAQNFPKPMGVNGLPDPITSVSGVQSFICGLTLWMFWGLIVFSIVMVLVAAFKYLRSGGEPAAVSSAGKTLLYAGIAIAVAVIAAGFPYIVFSFVGAGASAGTGACPG
jgi:hypothetical protein